MWHRNGLDKRLVVSKNNLPKAGEAGILEDQELNNKRGGGRGL